MEMIVYDCNYGDSLLFEKLQQMDDLSRLKTIMMKVLEIVYDSRNIVFQHEL